MKSQFPIKAYLELTKLRITSLVLMTTSMGYFLGGKGIHSVSALICLLIGTAAVCAGASALNHYLERDADKLMLRTKNRPLPAGIIAPSDAMIFGIILMLFGVSFLYQTVNLLTAFLSLLTAFLYVIVYTPLKKMSWLNTSIGAIPGALPPMGGWAAAANHLDPGAWALFLILFVWQHPHFYAIAWMFKEDYKRGGFKMLPVVEPDGKSTFWQIIIFSVILIPIALLPALMGISGRLYFFGAALLSCLFLFCAVHVFISRTTISAKNLFGASVIYLPLLLLLIVIDVTF